MQRLIASGIVAALVFAGVRAADPTPADTELQKVGQKAAFDQERMRRQFVQFQQSLLTLAQRLEKSAKSEDREKAVVLRQAIELAGREKVDAQFQKLVATLTNQGITLQDINGAIGQNEQLVKTIREMINLLLADSEANKNKDEQKRLADVLKQLDKVIRDQKLERSKVESGRVDPDQLAKGQEKVTQSTEKLDKSIGGDKQQQGERKGDAKAEAKNGKDAAEGKRDTDKPKADSKTGDPKAGDPKAGDNKPSDDAKAGDPKQGEPKAGDAKAGDPKAGEPKNADAKAGDPKAGEPKAGEPKAGEPKNADAKAGDPKDGDAKPSDSKPADMNPAGDPKGGDPKQGGEAKPQGKPEKGEPKPADEKKPNEERVAKATPPKPGEQPTERKAMPDGKAGEKSQGQDGDAKPMPKTPRQQSPNGPPPEGGDPSEPKDDPSEQQQQAQKPPQDQVPGRKKMKDAIENQKKAEKQIAQNQKDAASKAQDDAIKDLEEMRKEIERKLRQMREEELERLLANLETRCQRMLALQIEVYEGTKRVHAVIEASADKKPTRSEDLKAGELSATEGKIVVEVHKVIQLLEEDGTAVAFPAVFEDVRDQMKAVQARLFKTDVGTFTQGIESDIIASLKEMIDALKKAQQDLKDKKQSPPPGEGGGQPPPKDLIDKLTELKMIRSLQVRVNQRTTDYGKQYPGEQAEVANVVKEIRDLAARQLKIHKVTKDIATGKAGQ